MANVLLTIWIIIGTAKLFVISYAADGVGKRKNLETCIKTIDLGNKLFLELLCCRANRVFVSTALDEVDVAQLNNEFVFK